MYSRCMYCRWMAVHFTSMHSNTVWLTRARPTGDRWLATVTPIHWLLLSSPERSTVFEPNAQTTDCPSAQIQRVLCCNIAHSLVPEKKRMSVLETVNYCLQKKNITTKIMSQWRHSHDKLILLFMPRH